MPLMGGDSNASNNGENGTGKDSDTLKRNLIASIEAERGSHRRRGPSIPSPVPSRSDRVEDMLLLTGCGEKPELQTGNQESSKNMERLREELAVSQSTCRLLESELRQMEEKTLEAISEAGMLRKKLDEIESSVSGEYGMDDAVSFVRQAYYEKEEMKKGIEEAAMERSLLTGALTDSEMEIARLVKTLEMLSRRMTAA